MSLDLQKLYIPAAGEVANASSYNIDIAALFDAINGLEDATASIGNFAIDALGKLWLDGSSGTTYLHEVENGITGLNASDFAIDATQKLYFDGTDKSTYLHEVSDGVLGLNAAVFAIDENKKLVLDGDAGTGDTYILSPSADVFDVYVGAENMIKATEDGASGKIEFNINSTEVMQLDATGIVIPAATRYYAVPPSSLKGISVSTEWVMTDGEIHNAAVATREYYAPVNLPHGAIVTSVKAYSYTNGASSNVTCNMSRSNFTDTTEAMASTSVTNGGGNSSDEDTSITNATIDNSAYSYSLYVQITPETSITNALFYSCIVTYTITTPLP